MGDGPAFPRGATIRVRQNSNTPSLPTGRRRRTYASKSYFSRLLRFFEPAIDQYDYDSKQARSCASYVATMALCLRGGITDAKPEPKSDGSMPPSTGVTAMLWKSWITDPQSVVYKTLLARNDSLLSPYAGLIPGKDDNGDFSWGDSEKIYTPVTKIIASPDWGEELILPKVKGAIADVLAAYNGAVERLEKDVSKGIRPAATRLNSTALALYSRIWVTQLTVQITLRDYYQLLCDTTRQAQTEVANAIAKATGRAVPTEKQVRSVLMGGLLSLAVADPKLADRMVEVTLWVDGKARDIRNGLGNAVNHVTDVAKGKVAGSVSELKVLAGTLEPEARELLKGIMPSSEQVKNLTSRGLRGIGRSITSFELLASVPERLSTVCKMAGAFSCWKIFQSERKRAPASRGSTTAR